MATKGILGDLEPRLAASERSLVFADAQGATGAEDTVAEIARALIPDPPIAGRVSANIESWAANSYAGSIALPFSILRDRPVSRFESRLKQGLDDRSYTTAMEILAEAAIRNAINAVERRTLEALFSRVSGDALRSISNVAKADTVVRRVC